MFDSEDSYVIPIILCVVILMLLGGFYYGKSASTSVTHAELSTKNEENVSNILSNKTIPILTESLDAENLRLKYEFLNKRGAIGWIYIFTTDGKLMAEEPVINKLTSNNTFLTPMEDIGRTRASSDDPWEYYTYEMSDIDATYGVNMEGVFWFDPDQTYQELPLTDAIVLYSSERKSYDTPAILKSRYNQK